MAYIPNPCTLNINCRHSTKGEIYSFHITLPFGTEWGLLHQEIKLLCGTMLFVFKNHDKIATHIISIRDHFRFGTCKENLTLNWEPGNMVVPEVDMEYYSGSIFNSNTTSPVQQLATSKCFYHVVMYNRPSLAPNIYKCIYLYCNYCSFTVTTTTTCWIIHKWAWWWVTRLRRA